MIFNNILVYINKTFLLHHPSTNQLTRSLSQFRIDPEYTSVIYERLKRRRDIIDRSAAGRAVTGFRKYR